MAIRPMANPGTSIALSADLPSGGAYVFRVYDVQGRSMASRTLVTSAQVLGEHVVLAEKGLRQGVYFVTANRGAASAATKVVVIK